MANSYADDRRAELLIKLGGSGVGRTNIDLEREELLLDSGLNSTTGAKLSISDLGYREGKKKPPVVVNPGDTTTYANALYGTGTFG